MMQEEPLRVLVLGVGGEVSLGILKALALSKLRLHVVGACVDPLSVGLHTVDRAYLAPYADTAGYVEWLLEVCHKERIQGVFSGVEEVLEVLAGCRDRIRRETGAVCLVSSREQLAVCNDKLETCRWLERQQFNYPAYADSESADELERLRASCGYPLLAKPRRGKGAHSILRIENDDDLRVALRKPGFVVQEYLDAADEEYTVGCFCDADGILRGTICMKRELRGGATFRAEAGQFPEVRTEAERIVRALRPVGPCNVQLRKVGPRVVCFEINLRFSGSTPMRARLGFNEVEAALRHFILDEPAQDLPLITAGIALRYTNEIYVSPAVSEQLRARGVVDRADAAAPVVEDYGMSRGESSYPLRK